MKKKYVVITVSILFAVVAVLLLIQKNSYAEEFDATCPDYVSVEESDEKLGFIKTDYEQILLPKEVIVKNENTIYDYLGILVQRGNGTQYRDCYFDNIMSIVPNVSSDDYENRYYKQIIFWWLGDLLEGYDNNFNYISGREVSMESNSSDKYDSDGNYKYDNNLSALEKKAILESPMGSKISQILNQLVSLIGKKGWCPITNPDDISTTNINNIDMNNISYYATDDYIETSLIVPTVSQDYYPFFNYYTVEVGNDITVLDQNNNIRKEFRSSEGFKLRIPFSKINDNLNLKFTIQGSYRYNNYQYYHNKQIHSSSILPYLPNTEIREIPNGILMQCGSYDEELFLPLDVSYTETIGNLNIKVIDSSTGNLLPSAEVTVFDDKNHEVYRQTTSKSEINLKLPVGEYVVKQTITPPNYESITIQKRVTVETDDTAEAVLENVPLVDVPDTGMNIIIFDIIGGLILVAAGILVVITLRKKRLQG